MNRSWYTLIHIQKQNSRPHTLFFSRVSFWHIWASHLFRGPPPVALIVSAHYHVLQLLCSNLPARRDGIGVQGILEREKERSRDDTLRHFWSNTYTRLVLFLIFKISRTLTPIQPTVPFLLDNPPKRRQHTLLRPILARNMHPALNRNIRIRNTRRQQLPQPAAKPTQNPQPSSWPSLCAPRSSARRSRSRPGRRTRADAACAEANHLLHRYSDLQPVGMGAFGLVW